MFDGFRPEFPRQAPETASEFYEVAFVLFFVFFGGIVGFALSALAFSQHGFAAAASRTLLIVATAFVILLTRYLIVNPVNPDAHSQFVRNLDRMFPFGWAGSGVGVAFRLHAIFRAIPGALHALLIFWGMLWIVGVVLGAAAAPHLCTFALSSPYSKCASPHDHGQDKPSHRAFIR